MIRVVLVLLAFAEVFLISVLVALMRESRNAGRPAEKATDKRAARRSGPRK